MDYKFLKNNFLVLKEKLKLRGVSEELLSEILLLSNKLSTIKQKIIELNTERNKLITENALDNKEQVKELKKQIADLTKEDQKENENLNSILYTLPNIPDDSLSGERVLIKKWGTKKVYSFKLLSHTELSLKHSLFSLKQAALISGSGYVVYQGLGAKLFRALIQFTLDKNIANGYIEQHLPVIVSGDSLFGTAQLPKFEFDLFKTCDNKYLSPTSETQLVNLYRNRIIDSKELPIKLTANTSCFRKEAGSYGSETSGVIRLHQFSKTELVTICKAEDSFKYLEEMLKDATSILESLNLPYRVIQLPYNDMSFASAKTYDIEVWFPSENKYREISSISNTLCFQARRAMIRYKDNLFDKQEKTKFVHTLNGSSLAIDRLYAAILDNYQNEDSSITIPDVLHPYCIFKIISNN